MAVTESLKGPVPLLLETATYTEYSVPNMRSSIMNTYREEVGGGGEGGGRGRRGGGGE